MISWVFVIRKDFGEAIEDQLMAIGEKSGIPTQIFYQEEPLGTAHAILCAADLLAGKTLIGFADTLFQASNVIDEAADGVLWTKEVENPSAYGVVNKDAEGVITEFVEKPTTPVSNEAIIGIYYVREGEKFRAALQYLIDNNIRENGEYQITNALENLKQGGAKFKTNIVSDWWDCGNKEAFVIANTKVLENTSGAATIADDIQLKNSTIIEPCFIDKGVVIQNSVVGPNVSIGADATITNCIITGSVIQQQTTIKNKIFDQSMIGQKGKLEGRAEVVSLGDYTVV